MVINFFTQIKNNMKGTATLVLPAHFASALINDDYSGLSSADAINVQKILIENKEFDFVDIKGQPFFRQYKGVGCEVIKYQLLEK